MADGMGCMCSAHHESDCVCDGVDWTSSTEIALRAEVDRLTEQCDKLLSRPAYAAGYGAGIDAGIAFGLHRAATQIDARAHVVGERPWYGAIASELFAMAERIRNEK